MELHEEDQETIKELLIGRKVTKVNEGTLELDDGKRLTIKGNEGCGGCSSGWYELTELNECPDNAIMNVEFEHETAGDLKYYDEDQTFRVFVLAADRRIKLWEVEGNDGNGYYGTGYWIRVTDEPTN